MTSLIAAFLPLFLGPGFAAFATCKDLKISVEAKEILVRCNPSKHKVATRGQRYLKTETLKVCHIEAETAPYNMVKKQIEKDKQSTH